MGLLWEFPYFVEHGEGEASEVLFTGQVVEGVCVASEDDGEDMRGSSLCRLVNQVLGSIAWPRMFGRERCRWRWILIWGGMGWSEAAQSAR